MRSVHVHFYRPDAGDHWLNHVVTRFDAPYSHCDLQFDDGMATSVYQNESVYLVQNKTFSRENYDRVSLTLDLNEFNRMRDFCTDAHRRKVGFDLLGMVCTALPVGVRRPTHVTFCSRYVLEALQQTGRPELMHQDSRTVTPSGLHRTLSGLHNKFIHIPDKRMRLIS